MNDAKLAKQGLERVKFEFFDLFRSVDQTEMPYEECLSLLNNKKIKQQKGFPQT